MEEYTQQQRRQRSFLFIGAGLVFIVLIFLLIWFMKQRDQAYAPQDAPQTTVTQPSGQTSPEATSEPQSQAQPSSPTAPQAQSPSAPQNTTPSTPAPQQTSELPATGMGANLIMIVGAGSLSYVASRYFQSRQSLRRRS